MATGKLHLDAERIYLRPWKKNKADAKELFRYAKDPRVGPSAGWPVHKDVSESMEIIGSILKTPGILAIVLKETDKPIGSVGITSGPYGRKYLAADEGELGYWLGVPYWRQGLAQEAAARMIRYAFEELQMSAVWAAYFSENVSSKRLQERLGFSWVRREETYVDSLHETRTEEFNRLTREDWILQNSVGGITV